MSLSPTIVFPLNCVNNVYRVRTLLDPGSGTNWIAKGVLPFVEYTSVGSELLEVVTFNDEVQQKFQLVEVYYKDLCGDKQALRCFVVSNFTRNVVVSNILDYIINNSPEQLDIFQQMIDPASREVDHFKTSQGIGLILSSSGINKIRADGKVTLLRSLGILLEPTIFGVAVSGKIPDALLPNVKQVQVNFIAPRLKCSVNSDLFHSEDDAPLKQDIDFLWDQEILGVKPGEVHANEKIAMDHFINSVHHDSLTGHYIVSLPWNSKKSLLKDNARVAAARARRQQELMIMNEEYGTAMCVAFQTFIDDDTIEKVDLSIQNDNIIYYMPYRGIIKRDSKTTSCRIVMDASSKPSASDISLNQALYQGPNLTLELAVCLLQFMLGKYGVVADIEKAFLRILIALQDRDALRFFWFENPLDIDSNLSVFRFKAVIFGGVCSPFQLAAVLNKLIIDKCESDYVKSALLQGIYVDNVIHAHNSEQKLIEFFNVSRQLFLKGNFNLRRWSSNCDMLMTKAKDENVCDESEVVKVLGLYWNVNTDMFIFNTNFEWNGKFTKRSVLQFTNKVFDPLGLLTPISVRNRIFMQDLFRKKLNWNEDFGNIEDLKKEWLSLVKETHVAVTSTFKRNSYFNDDTEIHIFSDASKVSYGAIVYARTPPNPNCPKGDVHLAFAKGKVAPLGSKLTIPKLEVSGVALGARLVPLITKAWNLGPHHKFYLWCDAKVVLHWLAQFNIKEVFVHNRVKDIRSFYSKDTTTVRYVPSALNPADMITKPIKAKDFVKNKNYWSGPEWLLNENNWPEAEEEYNIYPEGVENTVTALPAKTHHVGLNSQINFFSRYSLQSGIRILAYVLRSFPHQSRNFKPPETYTKEILTKEELDHAKITAIRISQSEMFPNEVQTLESGNPIVIGVCRKWNLFIDSDSIIRCKGRLENLLEPKIKNDPILVNASHPFVKAFIKYLHIHSNCSSRQFTLHKVRKIMHGIGLTVAVKKIVRNCNCCRILRAQPYLYPELPPLPKERLAAENPFAVCGVDYSGPHHVKEGRSRKKVWIALFTCMVSRAVHLEAVPDLTSETFLQALQSLAWKKGTPRVLMSDNATTFVRANKILLDLANTSQVKNSLALKGISWKFTPARAPWFGAIYERLIGVLKKELIKLIGHSLLTLYELNVTLAEVEFLINSRPLVKVGEEEVITPNNILSGRNVDVNILQVLETEKVLEEAMRTKNHLPKLNQQTIKRKEAFWKNFQHQYLESIKFSVDKSKNKGSGLLPKEGDLVIMHSNDPRIKWRKAIVIKPIFSDDGQIRQCLVKMSTGETIRATKHLYPLEINVEDCITNAKANVQNNEFEGFSEALDSPSINKATLLKKYIEKLKAEH